MFWSPTLCHNSGNFPGINPTPGGGLHPPVKEDFPTLGVMWHAKTLKIRQNPQIDTFNCSGHFHFIWDIIFAQKWSKFGTERGTEKKRPGVGCRLGSVLHLGPAPKPTLRIEYLPRGCSVQITMIWLKIIAGLLGKRHEKI